MSKLKVPLFSLQAFGTLAKALTFQRRKTGATAEKYPFPDNVKTLAQLSWRHMYQKAVALWHALDFDEKQAWETSARPRHMTGFAYFMSQALRPNPGLYLPLQGGTMQGDIDMDGKKITALPDPTDAQDADTKLARDTAIAAAALPLCARITRTTLQSIPNNAWTAMSFDFVLFDTGSYFSLLQPTRLTVPSTAKYLIVARGFLFPNASGLRGIGIRRNGFSTISTSYFNNLGAAAGTSVLTYTMAALLAGDYVEMMLYQDSGAALNSVSTAEVPEFSIYKL